MTGGPQGAILGSAIGGTALPFVGGVSDWVANRYGPAAAGALRKLYQAMVRDGSSPQQLNDALTSLGDKGVLADVGDANVRQLAEGVANAPGPGQAEAICYLTARNAGQTQRPDDAVKIATGAQGSAFQTAKDLSTAQRQAATPAYESAFNSTVPASAQAQELQRFVENPMGQAALRNGLNNLQVQAIADGTPFKLADYGVTESPDGTYALKAGVPNLRLYDAVKRGYDTLVNRFRDPTTLRLNLEGSTSVPGMPGEVSGNAIYDLSHSYTQTLRQMFPQYAQALDTWAGPAASLDAISMGRRALGTDADVTADTISRLSPSERQMFQVGVAQALRDKIAGVADEADATRRIFGNQLIRNKIAASFGGEDTPAYQNFAHAMDREATFAQSNRQFTQGSPTARRTAAIAEVQGAPPPAHVIVPAAIYAATGNIPAAAMTLAHGAAPGLINRLVAPPDRVNLALGNVLYSPILGRQALSQVGGGGVSPSMSDILKGWQGQQAAQTLLPNRLQPQPPAP